MGTQTNIPHIEPVQSTETEREILHKLRDLRSMWRDVLNIATSIVVQGRTSAGVDGKERILMSWRDAEAIARDENEAPTVRHFAKQLSDTINRIVRNCADFVDGIPYE